MKYRDILCNIKIKESQNYVSPTLPSKKATNVVKKIKNLGWDATTTAKFMEVISILMDEPLSVNPTSVEEGKIIVITSNRGSHNYGSLPLHSSFNGSGAIKWGGTIGNNYGNEDWRYATENEIKEFFKSLPPHYKWGGIDIDVDTDPIEVPVEIKTKKSMKVPNLRDE